MVITVRDNMMNMRQLAAFVVVMAEAVLAMVNKHLGKKPLAESMA